MGAVVRVDVRAASFAAVARSGQHGVSRWVARHWDVKASPVIWRRYHCLEGVREQQRKGLPSDRGTPLDKDKPWTQAPQCALYENWTIDELLSYEHWDNRQACCIVRDLLNWFASWWHYKGYWPGEISNAQRVDVWRSNVQAAVDGRDGVVFVQYPRWVVSAEYRKELSAVLGGSECAGAFEETGGKEGGRSSFETTDYLNRWKGLREDKRGDPWEFITDEDLTLNKQLFGDVLTYPASVDGARKLCV